MIDLYPHQIQGAAFLSSRKFAGLFAGMGTGKTLTSLEAVRRVWDKVDLGDVLNTISPTKTPFTDYVDGDMDDFEWPVITRADPAAPKPCPNRRRVLIIAPPIALPMWLRETRDYLDVSADVSDILKTGKTSIKVDQQILVVSYAIAAKRSEELRDWVAEGVVIADESHALKSAKAKRTKAILGRGGVVSQAAHSWMLTGTPITRWNDDMFAFLCRADRKGMVERSMATAERFQLRYTVRQSRKFAGARFPVQMVVGNRNTDELADWIYGEGHALRFDLDEVFKDMPPLTVNSYTIGLDADPELKAMLKELERQSISDLRQKLEAKEPALATVRRRLGVAKVKAAAQEIKDRVESGQKVLVGAWHTAVIDELYAALGGCTRAVIDGRTSAASRETTVSEWNLGNVDVLIGQIAAMGVSLNLQQGGNQIIVVEEDWSPSVMDQFYARLWRFGQEKHVHVDVLQSESKLDAALSNISNTKRRQHQIFNNIGKAHTDAE